ncbi:MAG: accessory factor UbiK family protein [Alcanivoracaceae bacterium]|nr:accessory factor UbiK family protein [Alcanivoracaceae bacterium]
MNDQPFIDRIMAELSQRLPSSLGQLRGEVENNARAVLREAVARLDLISREEFDIQQQVLARTRAKLEQLEQDVRDLERQLAER